MDLDNFKIIYPRPLCSHEKKNSREVPNHRSQKLSDKQMKIRGKQLYTQYLIHYNLQISHIYVKIDSFYTVCTTFGIGRAFARHRFVPGKRTKALLKAILTDGDKKARHF